VVFVGREKQLVGQRQRGCHFVKNLAFSISFDKKTQCAASRLLLVNATLKWRKTTAIPPFNRFQIAFVQT